MSATLSATNCAYGSQEGYLSITNAGVYVQRSCATFRVCAVTSDDAQCLFFHELRGVASPFAAPREQAASC